jgi:hypothetical protein
MKQAKKSVRFLIGLIMTETFEELDETHQLDRLEVDKTADTEHSSKLTYHK